MYDFGLPRHPTVYDFVRSPRGRVRFWPCQPPVVYKNGRKWYTAGPLEGNNRTRQPSPVQFRAQIPHRQDRCPTFSQLGDTVAATPLPRFFEAAKAALTSPKRAISRPQPVRFVVGRCQRKRRTDAHGIRSPSTKVRNRSHTTRRASLGICST